MRLVRFYPEQALSRVLILPGLGTVITVGMVLFDLQWEAILRRVRIVRADLAAWEQEQRSRVISDQFAQLQYSMVSARAVARNLHYKS